MTPSRLDGMFKIHYFFLSNKYVHVLFIVRMISMTFFLHILVYGQKNYAHTWKSSNI